MLGFPKYLLLLLYFKVLHVEAFVTTTTPTVPPTTVTVTTTLASTFELHDKFTASILGVVLLLIVPLVILSGCVIHKCIAYRRESKVIDHTRLPKFPEIDPTYVGDHPPPRPAFNQREGTIAGPFGNPAYDDDDDDDRRSGVVTPSFISTRVTEEPGFSVGPRRYQYIP